MSGSSAFALLTLKAGPPTAYSVMIVLTRGEESGACADVGGMWSEACAETRLEAWTDFFTQMSLEDPSIPGDFAEAITVDLSRHDPITERDDGGELVHDPTAQVWLDEPGRGALVAFNAGDGDLTSDETQWALDLVLQEPELFGLPNIDGPQEVWGSYWYAGDTTECAVYPHPDHRAIADYLTQVSGL